MVVRILDSSLLLDKGGIDNLAVAWRQFGDSPVEKVTNGRQRQTRLTLVPSVPTAKATEAALVLATLLCSGDSIAQMC